MRRAFGLVYALDENDQALHREFGVDPDLCRHASRTEPPVPSVYVIDGDGDGAGYRPQGGLSCDLRKTRLSA